MANELNIDNPLRELKVYRGDPNPWIHENKLEKTNVTITKRYGDINVIGWKGRMGYKG